MAKILMYTYVNKTIQGKNSGTVGKGGGGVLRVGGTLKTWNEVYMQWNLKENLLLV